MCKGLERKNMFPWIIHSFLAKLHIPQISVHDYLEILHKLTRTETILATQIVDMKNDTKIIKLQDYI